MNTQHPFETLLTTQEVARLLGVTRLTVINRAAAQGVGRNVGDDHRSLWLFTPADVRRLRGETVPETDADRALSSALTTMQAAKALGGTTLQWPRLRARQRGLGRKVGDSKRGIWLFTPEEVEAMKQPGERGNPAWRKA